MPTSYRFTGQREDTTGLYFYNARYYDPVVGRFAQADTIVPQPGNPQGLNRYTYVNNNPVKYRDSTGHVIDTLFDIASVGADIVQFKNDPTRGNLAILAFDVGAMLIPGVPAVAGMVVRGLKTADKVVDATKAGERVLKITKNYRQNLMLWTGKTAEQVKDLQAHHLLPQKFLDQFRKVDDLTSIDDPRLLTWVDSTHQTWSKDFNDDWKAWFDTFMGTKPTLKQIYDRAKELAEKYGLDWAPPPLPGE